MVAKLLLLVLVVMTPAASAGAAQTVAAAGVPIGVPKERHADAHACKTNPKPTPRSELPAKLRIVDHKLIGNGALWTVPIGEPTYQPGGGWTRAKLPWFRLSTGPLTVTGHRVDGGAGAFHVEIPPVESYPLDLNASIGPGFIPSTLKFSAGGCWKVTAELARSRVVFYVDIDDSKQAICAQLAGQLRAARAYDDQHMGQRQVSAITSDQEARRCAG